MGCTIVELRQMLWFQTPKGEAIAKFLVDRGPESDNEWICVVKETGQLWSFSNRDVRLSKNLTLGIGCEWEKGKSNG